MKKLNKKGFAITTVIYSSLIIAVIVVGMLFSTMTYSKKSTDDMVYTVEKDLNEYTKATYPTVSTPSSPSKLCKRATTFHKEVCNQTSDYCIALGHKKGDTITYGNTSTTNGVLKQGDAFDCDVNGDGTYNSTTERFYYVSDYYDTSTRTFNTNYATLIYYNNVSGGVANNGAKVAYNSSNTNLNGPQTGYTQLPSTSQWSKVTLYKSSRQLLSTAGTSINGNPLGTFSYTGKAARLITLHELNSAYNPGGSLVTDNKNALSNCEYLLENTGFTSNTNVYGYWIETLDYSTTTRVYSVQSISNYVTANLVNNTTNNGIRPVIDVAKTNIDY